MIRAATSQDAETIAAIYNYYILNTVITFEEVEVSTEQMAGRIEKVRAKYPWLVFEHDGVVVGYAYATDWRERSAYRFSAESTIYLDQQWGGRGVGRRLYAELMNQLRAQGVHTVLGGIALPNAASVALHEKLGFVNTAQLCEVGFKHNRWIDVGYWQLFFEEKP